MSKTIDNKVVSIELEDKKFAGKANEVLGTLSKLKESMNFKAVGNAFDSITANIPVERMDQLRGAVEKVSTGFSVLSGAAAVALGNIASKAIQTGASMLSSFTLAPIMDGFREYQSQLDSVQTVLSNTASKGETIATVNAALDELNAYADKTIYNFGEMTRNVGTFTAAGVGLNDSVAAIKGFSNVAAAMGANSENTARGMYQLSQALATGTVKLMDWNSISNAGMGGEQFQEALKRTARNHGKAVDEMIAKEGSFRESLKYGWLDSSVMLETLKQYTGDLSREQLLNMGYTEQQTEEILKMGETANNAATKVKTFSQLIGNIKEALGSGWASIFRIIFGDFERAQNLWTGVANAIGGGIDAVMGGLVNILKRWDELGGWFDLWEGLGALFTNLLRPIGALGEGIISVFSGDAGQALFKFTAFFRHEIADWIRISDEFASDLKSIGKAVGVALGVAAGALLSFAKFMSIVAINIAKFGLTLAGAVVRPIVHLMGKMGDLIAMFKEWFSTLTSGLSPLDSLSQSLSKGIGYLGKWVDAFVAIVNTGIDSIFAIIGKSVSVASDYVKTFVNVLRIFVYIAKDAFGVLTDKVKDFVKQIGILDKTKQVFDNIGKRFEALSEKAKNVVDPKISKQIAAITDPFSKFESVVKRSGSFGAIFDQAELEVSSVLAQRTTDHMANLRLEMDAVRKIGGMLQDKLASVFAAPVQSIKRFASSLGDINRQGDFFSGMSVQMDSFANKLEYLGFDVSGLRPILQNITKGLQTMTAKLTNFFSGSIDAVKAVIAWVKNGFRNFSDEAVNSFAKFGVVGGILYTVGTTVVGLAKSVASGTKTISNGFANAAKSVRAFVNENKTFQEFKANMAKAFDNMGKMLSNIGTRFAHAFDNVSFADIMKGIFNAGVLAIVAKMVVRFFRNLNNTVNDVKNFTGRVSEILDSVTKSLKAMTDQLKSKALKNIAVSIAILAAALFVLAAIPSQQLMNALTAIGALTLGLVVAMKSLSKLEIPEGKLAKLGIVSVLLAGSVLLLAFAIRAISSLDDNQIMKGLASIGALVAGMTAVAKVLSKDGVTVIKGTGLMLAMAIAVKMLTKPIAKLGSMDTGTLMQGLFAVTVVIAGIGAAVAAIAAFSNNGGVTIGAALLVMGLGRAISALSEAVLTFGNMDFMTLVRGIVGIAASFGVLIGALALIPPSASVSSFGLLAIVVSLVLIANVIQSFLAYDWGTLLSATFKMAAVMLALVGIATIASGVSFGAGTFIILAAAMWLLAQAIKQYETIQPGTIVKALLAIAGGIAVLLAAAAIAPLVAPGLAILVGVIAALVGIALVFVAALTGFVIVLTTFFALLASAGPIIGGGFVAMAAGIAAGAKILKAVGPDLAAALKETFGAITAAAPAFGEAMMAMMMAIMPVIGAAIGQICLIIVEQGPKMIQALFTVLTALCQQLIEFMPTLVQTIVAIVGGIIDGLIQLLPKFGELAIQMVTTLCQVLVESVPQLADAALTCVVGLLTAIRDHIGEVVQTGLEIMGAFIEGLANGMVELVNAAFRAVITFINGLADAFDRHGPELNDAVGRLVDSIFNWLSDGLGKMGNRLWGSLTSLGSNLVDGIWNGISNAWSSFTSWLGGLAQGAINKVKGIFGIHSPSRVFAEIGKFLVLGLGVGAKRNADHAIDTMGEIANSVIDAFDVNANYEPTIKPIVDDSAIRSFANETFENAKYSIGAEPYNDRVALSREFAALRAELGVQKQVVFNQYNNSPKEIGLEELHNQTVSQLAYVRGVV